MKKISLIAALATIVFSGCGVSSKAFSHAKNGELTELKELMKKENLNVNLTTTGKYPKTLFEEAVKNKNFDIANYLLDKGVDVNHVIDPYQYDTCRPLIHKAAWNWSYESLAYLIEKGADVNFKVCPEGNMGVTPILYAVNVPSWVDAKMQIRKVQLLIDKGADIHHKSGHPILSDIFSAARTDEMKEFLKQYKQ